MCRVVLDRRIVFILDRPDFRQTEIKTQHIFSRAINMRLDLCRTISSDTATRIDRPQIHMYCRHDVRLRQLSLTSCKGSDDRYRTRKYPLALGSVLIDAQPLNEANRVGCAKCTA